MILSKLIQINKDGLLIKNQPQLFEVLTIEFARMKERPSKRQETINYQSLVLIVQH